MKAGSKGFGGVWQLQNAGLRSWNVVVAAIKVGAPDWALLLFPLSPVAWLWQTVAGCRGVSFQGGFLPQLLQTWLMMSPCSCGSWRCRKGCSLAGGCSRHRTHWVPRDHSSKTSPWWWVPGGEDRSEVACAESLLKAWRFSSPRASMRHLLLFDYFPPGCVTEFNHINWLLHHGWPQPESLKQTHLTAWIRREAISPSLVWNLLYTWSWKLPEWPGSGPNLSFTWGLFESPRQSEQFTKSHPGGTQQLDGFPEGVIYELEEIWLLVSVDFFPHP